MLDQLRRSAGGWAARILIGLLVLAFGVWGIADIFTGYTSDTVLAVGDEEVTLGRFQLEFDNELRAYSQRIGQPLTPAQGRQYGIDRAVLSRLVGASALNVQARELGLAVSDKMVATDINVDPDLQGPFGRVDPESLRQILQRTGITEEQFVEDRRNFLMREQLLSAVQAGVQAPDGLTRVIYQYQSERRVASYVVLPPESVGEIKDPEEDVIADYHQQAAVRFTRPELRSIALMTLDPDDLAANIELPEEIVREEYEQRRDSYDTPELRMVDQIPFATMEDARTAVAKLRAGTPLTEIVGEQGLTLGDVALGVVSRSEMLSPAIADVAFALAADEISEPVQGPLGPVVLRINEITPGERSNYEDVRDELIALLRQEKARDDVFDFQNTIEDERAGGVSLEDIAAKYNIPIVKISNIDAQGNDTSGLRPPALPETPGLLDLAFESDVDQELDPGDTEQQGYYWLRVDDIRPAELKPLDEVRDEVVALWKRESRKNELEKLAALLVERGNRGESLEAIAASYGRPVLTSRALDRRANDETFSRIAVNALFGVPQDGFAQGPVGFGDSVVVMQVKNIETADPLASPEAVARLQADISERLGEDLIISLVGGLREKYQPTVNQTLLNRLFTDDGDQSTY